MDKTPASMLECRRCGAGFDVSEMKPDTRFPCENCGAYLRVPRPKGRGGLIAAAVGLGVVAVAAVIYLLTTGGTPAGPSPSDGSAAAAATSAGDPSGSASPAEEAPEKIDLVQLEYEECQRCARAGGVAELLALGTFCRRHERYAREAEHAFRLVLKQEPEHEEALAALDLACLEGLYLPRAEHAALIKSKWFANARAVLDREVKNEQGLRDLGLSYAFAPPFLIVRERSDDETEDRRQRRRAAAVLGGMAAAFDHLVGNDLGVQAVGTDLVIPVFWHRTERAEGIWEDSRRPAIAEETRGKWTRNEHWRLVDEQDVDRLVLSPFAEYPAYEMVSALLRPKKIKLPEWLVDGLSCQIACLSLKEPRLSDPVVVHDVADRATLRAVVRDPKRSHAKTMVGLAWRENTALKRWIEELKKRGETNIKIEVMGYNEHRIRSRDAWAFVRFLLKSGPERRAQFIDYVLRMRKGEKWGAAFHAAFAADEEKQADIDALDAAWLDWMKAQGKTKM